jgi:hypothetical protein
MAQLKCLVLLLHMSAIGAIVPLAMRTMHLHTVKNARARGALCNDGSPATYYFRDCPRPADECAQLGSQDWLIVFAGGAPSETCFDGPSCAARMVEQPNATSSNLLNDTLESPSGIFSFSGEENPNFYAERTVLVPYCSSDMWVGNSSAQAAGVYFRGAAIARAVLEDLASMTFSNVPIPSQYGPGPNHTRLDEAASVALFGGAGIISQLRTLAALVPKKPRRKLRAVCDGCVISAIEPFVSTTTHPCTDHAASCPPSTVLKQGMAVWDPSVGSTAWRSLLAASLIDGIPLTIPTMVQHPQYDEAQLKQNRAWPVPNGTLAAAYANSFAASIRAALLRRPHGGLYTFAAACSPPTPSLFRSSDDFFCRPVACNGSTSYKLSSLAHAFLKDPTEPAACCVEDCGGFDCNAHCTVPQCWP